MVAQLPLNEAQIIRAAEELIEDFGVDAFEKASERARALRSEGYDAVANTWDLIREVIKDLQGIEDRTRDYKSALDRGVFLSE